MLSFIRRRKKRVALFHAIWHRDLKRVQELASESLELNFVLHGQSPLTAAVWSESRDIVDFLLAHGASPKMPGNEALLAGAARIGDHDLIDLALAAGHDIHFCRRHSTSPLQTAAFRHHADTMRYLIARGATKEDFDVEVCTWRVIDTATIKVIIDLGVEVPDEIVQCVKSGNWF